ncbi:MAG: radical SAM protein [Archaeoglobaceae archaeon]
MPRIEGGSYYTYLPEGCKLCRRGAKLVLFVTGLCNRNCFYCPISLEKKGRDVIYANERPVKSLEDFFEELAAMSAEGVAITGGEPLMRLERVIEYIRISKEFDLHVHLYTSIPAGAEIEKLAKAGLDEIRFHPPELRNVEAYRDPIARAKELGIDAGIEIPAIRFEPKVVEIVNELDAFLNVNQIEVSESNYEALAASYEIVDYYVENEDVVRAYEAAKKFHYCSARFKDIAQFRRRLIRMGMNMPDFYLVTRDGTVLCTRIEGDVAKAARILEELGFEYERFDGYVETSLEVGERFGELLKSEKLKVWLVERYPTFDATVVEKVEV